MSSSPRPHAAFAIGLLALPWLLMNGTSAQETRPAPAPRAPLTIPFGSDIFEPLPTAPSIFRTSDYKIRVVTVADGLSRPWSLAFLPSGDMLFTERSGQLRIIRNGVLDPAPIKGVPEVVPSSRGGLMDVVLHPKFAENGYVYLTYSKAGPPELAPPPTPCTPGVDVLTKTCVAPLPIDGRVQAAPPAAAPRARRAFALALARGRFDGHELKDVRDLLIADWTQFGGTMGARLAFGKDGLLYMSVSSRAEDWSRAQQLDNLQGKVLRLRDDGTAAPDNPFVKTAGARPEIYTLGHRNPLGLAVHPATGVVWENEMGPQGGDEVNILAPGRNYGWPVVSMGRDYSGEPYPHHGSMPGFEPPAVFWAPAIAVSGMTFYNGDKFPKWKDSVFVGSLTYTHLERVVFNEKQQHLRREWMLIELKQRIRDVRQGPDGYLYVLTDASRGAILRIEPTE